MAADRSRLRPRPAPAAPAARHAGRTRRRGRTRQDRTAARDDALGRRDRAAAPGGLAAGQRGACRWPAADHVTVSPAAAAARRRFGVAGDRPAHGPCCLAIRRAGRPRGRAARRASVAARRRDSPSSSLTSSASAQPVRLAEPLPRADAGVPRHRRPGRRPAAAISRGPQEPGSQGIHEPVTVKILTDRKPRGSFAQPVEHQRRRDVGVREVAATYHVPISNTAAGMMLLEPAG